MSIRFRQGDSWEYKGLRLRFERELGDHLLHFLVERTLAPFQIDDDRGGLRCPDHEWAMMAFAAGNLRHMPTHPSSGPPRKVAAAREYDPGTAAAIDPRYALRRFVLDGLDKQGDISLSDAAVRRALLRLWKEEPDRARALGRMPNCRTVRRWLETRGSPGERQTRQLISMSGRVPREPRSHPIIVKARAKAALDYWAVRGRSIEDGYARLFQLLTRLNSLRARRGLEPHRIPHIETFRLDVRRLECFETCKAKYGERKAAARFKGIGKGLTATRALRLGCMDHTLLDAMVVIDAISLLPLGRPWLTVLIDVRTRCVVGFVLTFEPPSNYAATECIKRANRPKLHLRERYPKWQGLAHIYGKFDEIVVDNGWELSGTSFQDTMADVGTTVRWAPIASPTYKAIVERFFRSLNEFLNHKLPGGVLKPELLREMGYDPSKDAVLTLEEVKTLIWAAISYYHIEEHRTLRRPPASLWDRDMRAHGIPVIGDERQLDKMAGALKPECRLTTSGVELDGLRFHDPATTTGLLEDLVSYEPRRGQRRGSAVVKVKAKWNPLNAAEIHVWNRRRNVYVTLPCVDEAYTQGLSFWQHQQIREWTRRKGLEFSSEADRLLARAQLIAEVEAAAPGLKIKQRRTVARLMTSTHVAEVLGERSVTVAQAPARHDGLAPIIEHDTLAAHRGDEGRPARRPPRGGSKASKRVRQPTASPSAATPATAPTKTGAPVEPVIDDGAEPGADWKEFKL
jgi:putative transposase